MTYRCACGQGYTPPRERPWTRHCPCGAKITIGTPEDATAPEPRKVDHATVKDAVLDFLNSGNKDIRRERIALVEKALKHFDAGRVTQLKSRDLKPFLERLDLKV